MKLKPAKKSANPIRLDDLLPRTDVQGSGPARRLIFGMLERQNQKRQEGKEA